ncbi:MAG: hypothetical protein Q9220_000820 [cf. Caloplaca sp. 1 TL-2023]
MADGVHATPYAELDAERAPGIYPPPMHTYNSRFLQCRRYRMRQCLLSTASSNWLVDLADHVPHDWKLHGFDMSSENYPAKEHLPDNVTLSILDCFEEPPLEMREKFDVLHVRCFALNVKGGDPGFLIGNLLKMLKPGGYIQWDDLDAAGAYCLAPNPTVSKQYMDRFYALYRGVLNHMGVLQHWPANLAPLLRSHPHNLSILAAHRYEATKKLMKPATDDWITALDQQLCNVVRRRGEAAHLVEEAGYKELVEGMAGEIKAGVSFWVDIVVVVGRKEGGKGGEGGWNFPKVFAWRW